MKVIKVKKADSGKSDKLLEQAMMKFNQIDKLLDQAERLLDQAERTDDFEKFESYEVEQYQEIIREVRSIIE